MAARDECGDFPLFLFSSSFCSDPPPQAETLTHIFAILIAFFLPFFAIFHLISSFSRHFPSLSSFPSFSPSSFLLFLSLYLSLSFPLFFPLSLIFHLPFSFLYIHPGSDGISINLTIQRLDGSARTARSSKRSAGVNRFALASLGCI